MLVAADWQAVLRVLRRADPAWITAALALAATDRLLLNYRWQRLLAAGGVPLRFTSLLKLQLAANFLGAFLPSSFGVDAVRITALCRRGEPKARVIAATLVDRASLVLATFLAGTVAVLALAHARIPRSITELVLTGTTLLAAAAALCFDRRVRRALRLRLLPHLPGRLARLLGAVGEALIALPGERAALLPVTVLTLMLFGVRVLFTGALALACGTPIPLADLALILPILWLLLMLPVTIGNLGLQDAGYVGLLALVGVGAPVAASISLLEHVVSRVISLPGAFLLEGVAARRVPET